MSAGIGSVASAVHHVADKAAVWPGDVFAADAAMPAAITASGDKVSMLMGLGYRPALDLVRPWVGSTNSFTYDGILVYWTGTNWYQFNVLRQTLGTGSQGNTRCDLSRLPVAKRIEALNSLFAANPTTPWAEDQWSVVVFLWPSGLVKTSHTVLWNGTSWTLVSTAPEYPGQPWDKTLTPGCLAPMEPTITAADSTNAAKLTPLGYTMSPAVGAPGLPMGTVIFPSPTTANTFYQFSWTGAGWQAGGSTTGTYAYNTFAHAGLAALPYADRVWLAQACVGALGSTPWSPGTYATIAGSQMGAVISIGWYPGPIPGTPPATPNKAALMPGDIFTNYEPGVPSPVSRTVNVDSMVVSWLGANGFKAHSSEKLAWRSAGANKIIRYVNVNTSWNGTHWTGALSSTKTTLTSTTTPVLYYKASASPAIASLDLNADRTAVVNSYWVASPTSAWAAGENIWIAGTIMRWDGTQWVEVAGPLKIHEAATIPSFPGDYFTDTRVTGSTTAIANQLLGWGYVPGYRSPWTARTELAWTSSNSSNITFSDTTANGSLYPYYWNGTAWTSGLAPTTNGTLVAPSAVVTDAAITALPAAEQVVACSFFGYYSNTGAQWTTGQSATIAGNVVHWHGGTAKRYWAPGAAP